MGNSKDYLTITKQLHSLANPAKAKDCQWFFKTGVGEYGEGDQFLGITVPAQRKVVNVYWDQLTISDTLSLLHNQYHEYRLTALLILVKKYQKNQNQDEIYRAYLANTKWINNWDLVDCSAHKIVGDYLLTRPRDILYKLAKSSSMWERRISIISTFAFIAQNDLSDALKLSTILVNDKQDLLHKAVGWVLREVGKKDQSQLIKFLDTHGSTMPRTMLRYAIEKLSPDKRTYYLSLR